MNSIGARAGTPAMSLSLSLVSTLFNTGGPQSVADGLLQTLYGGGSRQGVNTDPSQSLQALSQAEANQTQDIQATAQQPAVQRAITQFTAAVKSATSVQQLLRGGFQNS